MLGAIAAFEVKKRLGMISTYVYFAALFACAFLLAIAAGGAFASIAVSTGSDKVMVNSPAQLEGFTSILGHFGIFVSAAIFGQAVHQDYEARIDPLVFTTPIDRRSYLAGRYLGALVTCLVVFSSIGLGLFAASKMPFVDHALFGRNRAAAYLWPYLVVVVPNLIFTGALFFTMGALLRKMAPIYVTTVILVIGYLASGSLLRKIENKTLAGLIDPFGMRAVHVATEYFTTAEKNTRLVPLTGVVAGNRALWLALGVGALLFVFRRFRFAHAGAVDRAAATVAAAPPRGPLPVVTPQPGGLGALLLRSTWLQLKETVKSVYFAVIVLAGVLFVVVAARDVGDIYGTATWPVTYAILELAGGTFSLFVLILTTFYAGELVWRERDARMDGILDALPTPTWLGYASKLGALLGVQVVLLAIVMLTGIAIQAARGYFHFELGLYARELFGLRLIDYALISVLALAVQTLVQHKYVGHFVMVLYYLWTAFMGQLGLEHNLYRYASAPSYEYSDMNRYGHLLRPVLWFDLYWAWFAVLLAIGSALFWSRGVEGGLGARWREARRRAGTPLRIAAGLVAVAFALTGGFIFHNTNRVNRWQSKHQIEARRADYERTYKSLEQLPQPKITEVKVDFDLRPETQQLTVRGTYLLRNQGAQPISVVYVQLEDDVRIDRLALGEVGGPTRSDRPRWLHTFELPRPLAPGATLALSFELGFGQRGFRNDEQQTSVVANGTFFASSALPQIGYQRDIELELDGERRKYGLAPRARKADRDDPTARRRNSLGADADWIKFEAEIATAPDQLAFVPGYLEREWLEGGRRHFRYKMDAPILHFFSVLSARYAVRKDRWQAVELEIDYHPGHEYDLDRMMASIKATLDYCTSQFGPYQHRQVRIAEFPRYESFAQSFPNTIPYSESVGFIARVDPDDPDDIDYPYYITAHEVAHQWWGHQVTGGDVQGASMLAETLAQYSALMVMKKTFGAHRMRRFLKYELDQYLSGRGLERKKEVPLARVEDQPYIHYQKGSLVMYALQDYLGEETLNRALAAYVARVKFQPPPYTNTSELLDEIRKVTPPELAYVIDDLFEQITLYDNRARSATATRLPDGRYRLRVAITAHKLRAGELGAEEEVAMDDLVDIGALDDKGEVIALERRRVKSGDSEVELVVPRLPDKAGIDPVVKLIDRKPDDNTVRVDGG